MARRILIIEDDRHFSSQLAELFEFEGLSAAVALDGPTGLQQFSEQAFDLVLLDVMLPMMNGVDVLRKLRAMPGGADVPVVMMSAVYRSTSALGSDLQALGVLEFLSKPLSLMELGARVQAILSGADSGRAAVRAQRGRSAAVPAPTPTPAVAPPSPAPTRSSRSSAMPQEGQLNPARAVFLLTGLFGSHESGRLHLLHDGWRSTLYVLNGYPVWSSATPPERGLTAFLIEEGLITSAEARTALEHAARHRLTPRAAVLALGLLDADELADVLEEYVGQRLADALAHHGRFLFEPGDDFAGSVPVFERNPIRTAWSASTRLPQEPIARAVDSLAGRSFGRTRSFNRLFGYVADRAVLRELGEYLLKERTTEELQRRFANDWGLVRRCLWFLQAAGLLAVSDAPASSSTTREEADAQKAARAARKARRLRAQLERAGVRAPDQTGDRRIRAPEGRRGSAAARTTSRASEDPERIVMRDYLAKIELDYYRFLGLHREATEAEIESAYQELAPRYRPRGLPATAHSEVRRQAKQLMTRLMRAYGTLLDPARRRAYDEELGHTGPATGVVPAVATPPSTSRSTRSLGWSPGLVDPAGLNKRVVDLGDGGPSLARAHRAMAEGDYDQALGLLEGLRRRHPSDPGVLVDLGWCVHARRRGDPEVLEKALEWVDLGLTFRPGLLVGLEAKVRMLLGSDDRREEARPILEALAGSPRAGWARQQLDRLERELRGTSR